MVWGCSDNHHSVSEWLFVNPQTTPVRRNRCLQKLQNIKNLELSEHRTEFCLQALICWCSDLGSGICNLPGCKERPLNSSHTLWWWRTRTEPDRRTLEGTWTYTTSHIKQFAAVSDSRPIPHTRCVHEQVRTHRRGRWRPILSVSPARCTGSSEVVCREHFFWGVSFLQIRCCAVVEARPPHLKTQVFIAIKTSD